MHNIDQISPAAACSCGGGARNNTNAMANEVLQFEALFGHGNQSQDAIYSAEAAGPLLTSADEEELTFELMGASSEAELEQFFGNFFKKIGKAVGGNRGLMRMVSGATKFLKPVVKTALPMVGSAVGNAILPGLGGMAGGMAADMASKALGLEMENVPAEDRQYYGARNLVSLAHETVADVLASPDQTDHETAAKTAVMRATKKYLPGLPALVNQAASRIPAAVAEGVKSGVDSGRWFRRNGHIVLVGV